MQLITRNWTSIKTNVWKHRFSTVYNIRIPDNSIGSIFEGEDINNVFEDQKAKFKINASVGSVLINHSNGKMRYWHASANKDRLFEQPVLIENEENFQQFKASLAAKDLVEEATRSRPDTKWTLHCLTNLTIFVYPINDHPIGGPTVDWSRIKSNKALVSAVTDSNGRAYSDNLCLFRAISLMKGNRNTLEKSTKHYFYEYLNAKKLSEQSFEGISLTELPAVERIFHLSISVYALEDSDSESTTVAKLIHRSTTGFKEKLNLHLEASHYSWIKNLSLYTKSYRCSFCSKLLKTSAALKNHALSCSTDTTKFVYPYGEFKPVCGVFDMLEDAGVYVDQSRRYYPYYSVFDCESFQSSKNLPKDTETIHWESHHNLASVSLCSNVNGFTEPVCFVNDSGSEFSVVRRMLDYLTKLSELCYERLLISYSDVFTELDKQRQLAVRRENLANAYGSVEGVERKFDRLRAELQKYLRDLPVFGFNSGKYDIPLIKHHMLKYFQDNDEEVKYVIKKGTNHMCVQSERLRFLDITNYLAPGFSYSQYLKAMEVESGKFFWIHDKFTDLEVLNQTSFPKYEDFYSALKQKNITRDEYEYCKRVWDEKNMKTLRDLLIYYNNCDVKGFVEAISKQCEFFRTRKLDIKSAISIPGLSLQYLFQTKDSRAPIFMFGQKNRDLYDLIKSQIRGGLSMVYSRWQQVGVTQIKPETFGEAAKTTQSCEGQDVSGMYLSNLCRSMPTGPFVRRRRENDFKLERCISHSVKAVEWIKWLEREHGVEYNHAFNGGEKKVGGKNLPVDGWAKLDDGTEVILQFSGCWYHSHMCELAPRGKGQNLRDNLENQLKTLQNLQYFQLLGYKVYHTWECEFENLKAREAEVKNFCKNLNIAVDTRYKISEDKILSEVKSGDLFGMVECDIETPKELEDLYGEFQPIAKHAFLSRNDIGEHMKRFCAENDLLKKPTKALLCSYFGRKILLATPLLQWYLNHGLKVTKVYQVVQYKPIACFKQFGEEVMKARREGDADPSKKILSDSAKLIGQYII